MHFSDTLLQEICEKNDIVSVISSYITLKQKGNNYWGVCPFHNEKTPSFSVDPSRRMFYCFGCHAGGNVITFVTKYENMDFSESVTRLAQNAGIRIDDAADFEEQSKLMRQKKQLLAINKTAATYYYKCLKEPQGANARQYLAKRGVHADIINSFGLGLSPSDGRPLLSLLKDNGFSDKELIDSGIAGFSEERGLYTKFWNRVMFPIQDLQGRVIGFGGRVIGGGEPKYLNTSDTPIFAKGSNLFAQHISRKNAKKFLILCEGYMDVIALHRAGFPQAVACLGTALTSQQALLIKRFCDKVYLAYDADSAGIMAALRALPILASAGITAKIIDLRPYKDPDELICALGKDEFLNRIDTAQNAFLFEMLQLKNGYNLNDPTEKTAFFREVAKKIAGFSGVLERESYIAAIAEQFLIRAEHLKELVTEYAVMGANADGISQTRPTYKPRLSSVKRADKKDKLSTEQAQAQLLTLLLKNTSLVNELKDTLSPEDFADENYAKIYQTLIEHDKAESQAMINAINAINDESGQSKAAALFFEADESADTVEPEELKRQAGVLCRIVKQKGIELRSKHLDGNPDEYRRLLQAKRDAERL